MMIAGWCSPRLASSSLYYHASSVPLEYLLPMYLIFSHTASVPYMKGLAFVCGYEPSAGSVGRETSEGGRALQFGALRVRRERRQTVLNVLLLSKKTTNFSTFRLDSHRRWTNRQTGYVYVYVNSIKK